MNNGDWGNLGSSSTSIASQGCTVDAWTNIINTENGNNNQTPKTVGGKDSKYMSGSQINTRESAYNGLTGNSATVTKVTSDVASTLANLESSSNKYYVTGRADISYVDKNNKIQTINHEVNITGVILDKDGKVSAISFQGTSTNDDPREYQMTPVKAGTTGVGQITEIYYVESSKKLK